MSFDNVARIAGFTGADLSALLAIFAKASANIDPTHHDELGRRLIKLYRAGVRDPDMLESFAADALKPSRRKREVPRTLYGEAGIINVCDM